MCTWSPSSSLPSSLCSSLPFPFLRPSSPLSSSSHPCHLFLYFFPSALQYSSLIWETPRDLYEAGCRIPQTLQRQLTQAQPKELNLLRESAGSWTPKEAKSRVGWSGRQAWPHLEIRDTQNQGWRRALMRAFGFTSQQAPHMVGSTVTCSIRVSLASLVRETPHLFASQVGDSLT